MGVTYIWGAGLVIGCILLLSGKLAYWGRREEGGGGGGLTLYAIVYDIENFIALPFTLMKTLCRNVIEMSRKA